MWLEGGASRDPALSDIVRVSRAGTPGAPPASLPSQQGVTMNPWDPRTAVFAKHAQHVVLIHFPIALFITGVAFDFIATWKRRKDLALVVLQFLRRAAGRVASGADWLAGLAVGTGRATAERNTADALGIRMRIAGAHRCSLVGPPEISQHRRRASGISMGAGGPCAGGSGGYRSSGRISQRGESPIA
jgi:hypothetical protein